MDVSRSFFADGPDECGGIVGGLLVHHGILLASLHPDRVGRADIRSGCHRRDVGCENDEGPRRGGLRTGGGDIHQDGKRGGQQVAHDVACRLQQSPGSVQLYHEALGTAGDRLLDRMMNVFGSCGIYRCINRDNVDGLAGEERRHRGQENDQKEGRSAYHGGHYCRELSEAHIWTWCPLACASIIPLPALIVKPAAFSNPHPGGMAGRRAMVPTL